MYESIYCPICVSLVIQEIQIVVWRLVYHGFPNMTVSVVMTTLLKAFHQLRSVVFRLTV